MKNYYNNEYSEDSEDSEDSDDDYDELEKIIIIEDINDIGLVDVDLSDKEAAVLSAMNMDNYLEDEEKDKKNFDLYSNNSNSLSFNLEKFSNNASKIGKYDITNPHISTILIKTSSR